MMPREEFLKRLGLATGAPFEPDALTARITSYIDTRRAAGTTRRASRRPSASRTTTASANLTLTVAPGPHVSVVFSGDPLPGATRTALVPIEREGSADEDLLEDSSNRIEEFLRAQGYRDAMAPHTRQETDGELLITFAVHKGSQYRVGSVEISGGASLPLPDLRTSLRTRVGEPFSDANLDADVTAIESVYRGRGFAVGQGAGRSASRARRPADADANPGRGQHPHYRRGPHGGRHRAHRGQRVGSRKRDLRQTLSLQPGTPYFDAQLQTRHRRDAAAVRESRVPVGDRAGPAGVHARIARRRISCSPSARARGFSSTTC